jgi:hypothetical protein
LALAEALRSLLNSGNKIINIQNELQINSLRKFKLFREHSNVIILSSVISSSETIRRLVKYIKRDNANPILILGLINNRNTNISKLETWNDFTKIISIFTKNQIESTPVIRDKQYLSKKISALNSSDLLYINPDYTESNQKIGKSPIINSDILVHYRNAKALHYNHIGINNDRHFTFYIDKKKLLNYESTIWEKLDDNINEWINKYEIKNYRILIKSDLCDSLDSLFVRFLVSKNHTVSIYEKTPDFTIENELSIYVVEFGVFSGITINGIISSISNVKNLKICTIFNQCNQDTLSHYKKIKYLSNNGLTENLEICFDFDFLFNLPLNFYSIENCPICAHRESLEQFKMSQIYMHKFSEDRQQRLSIRDKNEIESADFPYDFYFSKPESENQELSSTVIAEMFQIKCMLENSLYNTNERKIAFQYIFDIYCNLDLKIQDASSNLYSLLYYLSNEIHWLQKEPLYFRDFRIMLTEISKRVAIIDVNELSTKFKKCNDSKISSDNCAIRYKYSAISVLRSSNKLEFCKSLSDIIASSKLENSTEYSNNLLQNCFYHIYSVYKNKYNKSQDYYSNINIQLLILRDKIDLYNNFTDIQINSYKYLVNFSDNALLISDIDRINSLSNLLKQYYDKFNRHPYPIDDLQYINFQSKFPTILIEELKTNRTESYVYPIYIRLFEDIVNKWDRLSMYINSIQDISKNFDSKIKNSLTFKTYFGNEFVRRIVEGSITIGINDELTDFISKIAKDPLNYLSFKDSYDELIRVMESFLIKRESKLERFVKSFPTDAIKVLEKKFTSHVINGNFICKDDRWFLFYPYLGFLDAIDAILKNIKERLIKGKTMSDILCNITLYKEMQYTYVVISYNSTTKDKLVNQDSSLESSGLSIVKNELGNFGGDLVWNETKNDFFELKFKFLSYE